MRKIIFHLNNLDHGGAERVVTTMANYFVSIGDNVFIATEETVENEFSINNKIQRVNVGLSEKQKGYSRLGQFSARIKNLRRFLNKEKPDIVIAFATKASYRAIMATLFTKFPVIISIRCNPFQHYTNPRDRLLTAVLFSRAEGNVFQTEGAKSFFSKKIQRQSRIIINPINEKYIGCPKPDLRRKAVVQSGRLTDFKNQLMLIEAFMQVHKKHPDYVLEIYGGDSKDGTKELLEASIEKNQAREFITLMGDSDALEKQLIDASVFAFSSDYEGLPNALLEALAMGLPVVATDCPCGGPRTLIRDGENGLLVPIKDAEAMAAGINRLIEDEELAERLGENARHIANIANTEAICNQWKEYIEDICRKNH